MCTMWACMLPLQGWDDVDVAPTAEELAKEQHHAQVFAAFQDDKEPLAENVPNPTADALLSNSAGVEPTKAKPVWADAHGMPPTCPRASNDHNYAGTGKLKNYPTDPLYQDVDGNPTRAGLFLHFCPLQYWRDTVIPATNTADPTGKLNLTTVDWLTYIALRLFMSCYYVSDIRHWFRDSPPCAKGAPFRLGSIMSGRKFQAISKALVFSLFAASDMGTFNPFYSQQKMETAFNANMKESWPTLWQRQCHRNCSTWCAKHAGCRHGHRGRTAGEET